MSPPVQLVVFDLMGTLVRDDGTVDRAYEAALAHARIGEAEMADALDRVAELRGRPTLEVLRDVLGDPVRAEEATWAFDDRIIEEVPSLEPIEGAVEVLDALEGRGVLVAVTTSFGSDVRKRVVDRLGWADRFAAQLSAHGNRRGHPAPDLLLEAIVELGIDSVAQVAMVGDTVADLEAGNRAGSGLVIGVLTGTHDRDRLRRAPHTHLVDSVADVLPILDAPRAGGYRRRGD